MKKSTIIFVFLSLAFALGFTACSLSLAQDVTPPPGYQPPIYEEPEVLVGVYPKTAPNPANGAAIYQEKCQPCHGDTGLGNGPDAAALPVETAQIGAAQFANQASPLAWYSMVSQGNIENFMPPFSGSLDEQDIWDVLSYVYTFGKSAEKTALGEEVFASTCAECHGADGSGAVPGAADLTNAERMVELSVDDIILQVATGNGNQDHVFSTVLDAEQQENVAYYLRSLVFPLEGEGEVAEQTVEDAEEQPADENADQPADEEETAAEDAPAADEAGDESEEIVTLGVVSGQVTQAGGEELPEGLEVSLEVYQHFEPVLQASNPVEEDGSFIFEGVPIVPDQIYIAVVEFDGLFYPSEFYVAQPEDTHIELPVTVYSPTASTDSLSVSRIHVFFQFTGEGTVQVIHQVTISNSGSQMVAPENENEPVLNFTLPDDAQNLIFQTGAIGAPYIKTDDGFGDPTAVLPGDGTYEVLFAYELPYSRSLEWQIPVDLPSDVAVVFVQGEDVKVSSNSLQPSGSEMLDTELFQVFVANNLPAGETLDLDLSGRVGGGTTGLGGETNWLVIGAGAVGVLLAAFGAWQFFRPVDEVDEADEDVEALDRVPAQVSAAGSSEQIMDQIIALDEAYEAGNLDEEAYTAQRDELKAALKAALDEKEGA